MKYTKPKVTEVAWRDLDVPHHPQIVWMVDAITAWLESQMQATTAQKAMWAWLIRDRNADRGIESEVNGLSLAVRIAFIEWAGASSPMPETEFWQAVDAYETMTTKSATADNGNKKLYKCRADADTAELIKKMGEEIRARYGGGSRKLPAVRGRFANPDEAGGLSRRLITVVALERLCNQIKQTNPEIIAVVGASSENWLFELLPL